MDISEKIFRLYSSKERSKRKKEYRALCKLQKQVARNEAEQSLLDEKIKEFIADNDTVSAHEVMQSLNQPVIVPLSLCIKFLYWVCAVISLFAFLFALFLTVAG